MALPTEATDTSELSYTAAGQGDTALMLIHGWMTTGAVFSRLLELLDTTKIRCISVDLRGAGSSASGGAPVDHSLRAKSREVWSLIDHLGVRPVLVGHSMGGQIAQLMAAERPGDVKGLLLLCSVPARGFPLDANTLGLFESATKNRELLGTILDAATKQLSAEDRSRLLAEADRVDDQCLADTLAAWLAGGFEPELARITAPTLAVATDDPFITPALTREQVAQHISRCRVAVLPGPGHYPQVEAPAPTAALIESFLAGLGY